jgi:hypothetical protein
MLYSPLRYAREEFCLELEAVVNELKPFFRCILIIGDYNVVIQL